MAKFKACAFEDKQAYNNFMSDKNDLRFGSLGASDSKYKEAWREDLEEMFEYAPTVKEFDSWEELGDFLEEHDYTIWQELGDLEEREICSKCGATVRTNSDARLEMMRNTHQIQVCPEDRDPPRR